MKTINKANHLPELVTFLSAALPFYQELTDNQQRLILENCILRSYNPNEVVHNSWEQSYGLYLIRKGVLQGFAISSFGKEFSLFAVASGESSPFFCDAILIDEGEGFISFKALHNAEIIFIPRDTWEELLNQSIPANRYALAISKQMVGVIVRSLQAFMFLSVEKKLALHLWEKINLQRMTDPESDTIRQTHEEIAYVLGTSREAVSRTLNLFKQKGLLETYHGKIRLTNYEGLNQMVRQSST